MDIYPALLGFRVESWQRAHTKHIVRGLLVPFHVQAVFGDHLPILRSDLGRIPNIPTKGLEQGINERLPNVGFLDPRGKERLAVNGEVTAQLGDFIPALIECLAHSIFLTSQCPMR